METKDYPKEWQTNKNLRWWLSLQDDKEMFVTTGDERVVYDCIAVEFAKQFHAEDIAKKDETIKAKNSEIRELKKEVESTAETLCNFIAVNYSMPDKPRFAYWEDLAALAKTLEKYKEE